MPDLSNFSPEVIQNYIFPYLHAFERGKLEQTNKRFRDLSRNYLSEDLKKNFGIEREKLNKFSSTNPQEAIRLLYIYLFRCSKILNDSEMEAIIQAIREKNEGPIEEMMIICQEIKITTLKKKISADVAIFFEKMEQLLIPWIPDLLLTVGGIILCVSPFLAIIYSMIWILAAAGLASAFPVTAAGSIAIFFITLSLVLLLYASSGLIVEKIKLASEYSILKQLKVSLESKRASTTEPLENSFSCDEETTSSVSESATLANTSNTFFKHRHVPSSHINNDLHKLSSFH